MISSHYAEPLARTLARSAQLRSSPAKDSKVICELEAGALFEMLDNSLGAAWGYAGPDRRVGYVDSEALEPRPS